MAEKPKVQSDQKTDVDATAVMMKTIIGTTWRMFVPSIGLMLVGLWADLVLHTKPWLMVAGIIFDEPTSGLDYTHMMQTGEIIQKLSHEGYIVLVITHDYEFLNLVCHSVIQLGGQGAVKGRMQSEEEMEEKEKKLV